MDAVIMVAAVCRRPPPPPPPKQRFSVPFTGCSRRKCSRKRPDGSEVPPHWFLCQDWCSLSLSLSLSFSFSLALSFSISLPDWRLHLGGAAAVPTRNTQERDAVAHLLLIWMVKALRRTRAQSHGLGSESKRRRGKTAEQPSEATNSSAQWMTWRRDAQIQVDSECVVVEQPIFQPISRPSTSVGEKRALKKSRAYSSSLILLRPRSGNCWPKSKMHRLQCCSLGRRWFS